MWAEASLKKMLMASDKKWNTFILMLAHRTDKSLIRHLAHFINSYIKKSIGLLGMLKHRIKYNLLPE
jgi:hypothetical protein